MITKQMNIHTHRESSHKHHQRDSLRFTVHTVVSPWHSWVDQIDNSCEECVCGSVVFVPGIPVLPASKPQSCTLSQHRSRKIFECVWHFLWGQFDPRDLCLHLLRSHCFSERRVCAGGTRLHRRYLTLDFPSLCTPTFLSSFEVQPNPTEKCSQIQMTAKTFSSSLLLFSARPNVLLSSNSVLLTFPHIYDSFYTITGWYNCYLWRRDYSIINVILV